MSETVESVGNFQDRYIPEDIVERYFSLSSNKKKKDYLSSTDEEYYKKITFENDTNYLYHLIEQNYLPDVLAPKDYHMLDTKYSQLSQIYMTYGALIGLLKAKAEGFLPIVLFTGSPSIGKTSVALWLTTWLSSKLGKPFNPDRCFLIGRNEYLLAEEVETRFEPNDIIFIDEIQHMFNRYRVVSDQNVEFIKFLDSCRKYGIGAVISTTPRFGSSDPNYRSELVQLWFHVNFKDAKKKKSRCFLNINTETADGRELDYEKFGNLWFKWCREDIYKMSVDLAQKEIYQAGSIEKENIREKKERLKKEMAKRRVMLQISDVILDNSLDLDDKISSLLDLGVSQRETHRLMMSNGFDIKFPYVQQRASDLKLKQLKEMKKSHTNTPDSND